MSTPKGRLSAFETAVLDGEGAGAGNLLAALDACKIERQGKANQRAPPGCAAGSQMAATQETAGLPADNEPKKARGKGKRSRAGSHVGATEGASGSSAVGKQTEEALNGSKKRPRTGSLAVATQASVSPSAVGGQGTGFGDPLLPDRSLPHPTLPSAFATSPTEEEVQNGESAQGEIGTGPFQSMDPTRLQALIGAKGGGSLNDHILKDSVHLLPHQVVFLVWALLRLFQDSQTQPWGGLGLFDGPGLGKTLQALALYAVLIAELDHQSENPDRRTPMLRAS